MTTETELNVVSNVANVVSEATTPSLSQYLFTLQVKFSVADDPEARSLAKWLIKEFPEAIKCMSKDSVVTKLQEIKKSEPPRKIDIT
jgi:hypothetical protein